MKAKTLCVMLAVCVALPSVSLASQYWTGVAGDNDWDNTGNWAAGVLPAAHALILGGNAGGDPHGTFDFPVIGDGDSVGIGYTSLNWHGDAWGLTVPAQLTVSSGGFFYNSEATLINRDLGTGHWASNAEINITDGGQMVSSVVMMSHNAGSYARINISGNNSYLNAVGMDFGTGDSAVDIQTQGAYLLLSGDQTAAVAQWITAGNIIGAGGTLDVDYSFENSPIEGLTAVWLVPEPATLGLLGLGGLTLLRRRR